MEQRQLSVSIIQAINRVRCRRVIDAEGRSPNADVSLYFRRTRTATPSCRIFRQVVAEGLNVVDWQFELDGPKVRRPRKGTSHEALISFMGNRLPGETPMSHIQRELGLQPLMECGHCELFSAMKEHATTKALQQVGVEYVTRGQGRGAKSFLVKHAPA